MVLPFGNLALRRRIEAAIIRADAGSRKYSGDGMVFRNREQRLPPYEEGYYREFTVDPVARMPGRGPERIVIGDAGECYYTPDHYVHFVRFR